jgi:hypothetical protein
VGVGIARSKWYQAIKHLFIRSLEVLYHPTIARTSASLVGAAWTVWAWPVDGAHGDGAPAKDAHLPGAWMGHHARAQRQGRSALGKDRIGRTRLEIAGQTVRVIAELRCKGDVSWRQEWRAGLSMARGVSG